MIKDYFIILVVHLV